MASGLCISRRVARLRAVKKPPKALIWTIAGIGLALLAVALEVLRFGGAFRAVKAQFAGNCRAVTLDGSSEDIQVDMERGVAYLSLLDRDRAYRGKGGEGGNGSIVLLDLNLADPAPRAAMSFDPANFRPHGLSLLKRAGQPARLFAVSHPADGSQAVEIAEQDPGGAFIPRRTVRDPAFVHPNAIVAVGAEQFYLVNDRMAPDSWRARLRLLMRSGDGTLVYFDGEKARVLVNDLAYPAGLALSPDGTRLYVAEAVAQALRVYARDAASGALTLERTVELGTAPDNLNVDAEGVVWIAAHPRLLRFVAHARDARERAPTQVLNFDPRKPDAGAVSVYTDDGMQLSAGTVAARWRDEFLVGALLDKKVLICKPNP
jgi:arylesterase/paraoxonase